MGKIPEEAPCTSSGISSVQDRFPCLGLRHLAFEGYVLLMSPTVFREGPFRFFFFSREELRIHVHVIAPDGEAKFWLEPEVALASSSGLAAKDLGRLGALVRERKKEILDAWHRHFPG